MVSSRIENNFIFAEEKVKISDFPTVQLLKDAIERQIKIYLDKGWYFVTLENCGKYIAVKFRLARYE